MPLLLTSDGVALHHERSGAAGAPAVVLLHGLGSDAAGYDALVAAIGDRLDVARLDLRGHGRSEPLADPARYGWFGRAALDVVELCDALGWEAPGLAGGSLGAAVATATARGWPERVGRLALMGPAITAGPDLGNPVVAGFLAGVQDAGLLGLLDAVVAANPDVLPAAALAEARANYARQDDAAMRACCAALSRAVLLDSLDDLAQVRAPALVVAQHGDLLHPFAIAEQYAAHLPQAVLLEAPDALADPARLANLLVDWFA